VISRGALETGQVGSHCQPQLISEGHQMIGGNGRQFGEVHHAKTLRLLPAAAEACERARRGMSAQSGDTTVCINIQGTLATVPWRPMTAGSLAT
jgi:hypothetical protein